MKALLVGALILTGCGYDRVKVVKGTDGEDGSKMPTTQGPAGPQGEPGTPGAPGKDGVAGIDGQGCSIEKTPDEQFAMLCPDGSRTPIPYKKLVSFCHCEPVENDEPKCTDKKLTVSSIVRMHFGDKLSFVGRCAAGRPE